MLKFIECHKSLVKEIFKLSQKTEHAFKIMIISRTAFNLGQKITTIVLRLIKQKYLVKRINEKGDLFHVFFEVLNRIINRCICLYFITFILVGKMIFHFQNYK